MGGRDANMIGLQIEEWEGLVSCFSYFCNL